METIALRGSLATLDRKVLIKRQDGGTDLGTGEGCLTYSVVTKFWFGREWELWVISGQWCWGVGFATRVDRILTMKFVAPGGRLSLGSLPVLTDYITRVFHDSAWGTVQAYLWKFQNWNALDPAFHWKSKRTVSVRFLKRPLTIVVWKSILASDLADNDHLQFSMSLSVFFYHLISETILRNIQ
jgi:hypothetical protein